MVIDRAFKKREEMKKSAHKVASCCVREKKVIKYKNSSHNIMHYVHIKGVGKSRNRGSRDRHQELLKLFLKNSKI